MTRVLITVSWGERLGGAEEMLWTFLRGHSRDRVSLHVVFFEAGSFEREVAHAGIPTSVLPGGRLRHIAHVGRVAARLGAIIRREQPDVVLNWAAKTHVYASLARPSARTRAKHVWWQHGIPPGGWLDRVATAMPADAVGCSSHAIAEAQRRMWPRRHTFVVHPGVEAAERPPAAESSIPPGRKVIGIVGRLQEWKGQDRFLLALAELRRRGHALHGLLVGGEAYGLSAGYGTRLEAMIDDLELRDAVTVTGQVRDPLPHIARMDVLVNLSRGEPFGLVLLEAMSVGTPVIAVADGGPLEIVEPEQSGILVPSTDPSALADVLERVLGDDDLRQRLGEGGRTRFLSRFTSERMSENLEGELLKLART